MLLNRNDSFLLLVDLQERLLPAIGAVDDVLHHAGRLVAAATRLGVPVFATEHCPDRIGPTTPALTGRLKADAILSKTHFSAGAEAGIVATLAKSGRRRPVIGGTEAHVCVLQTALSLKAEGFEPAVVADACGSRFDGDHRAAMARLASQGVEIVTTEMVMFEWLAHADDPNFRDLLPVIKKARP